MAAHAFGQDLSGWSDKTVCRVAKATPNNTEYQTELTKRGLSCGGSAATSSNTFEMQNPDKYCSSVILPNDVASAKKYTVCLFDKTALKEYGLQVVDKKDGHPVRAGSKSMRFELRDGDCNNPPPPNWNDCKSDRERFELSGRDMSDGEEGWFAWSLFIPKDYENIETGANDLGQFNLEPGEDPDPCCVFTINKKKSGYVLEMNVLKSNKWTHQSIALNLSDEQMSGNWSDFIINFKWSKKDDGFIKLWLNNELVYERSGQNFSKDTKFTYFKFGIYRSALSRYLNHKNFSPEVEACFEKNGASTKVINLTKKDEDSPDLGWGANAISFKIYNQCKHLYKIKVPTQVVYYDEIRSAETCKKLKLEDLGYNCKETETQEQAREKDLAKITEEKSKLSIFEFDGEAFNLALDKVEFIKTGSFKLERSAEYLMPWQLHKGFINGKLKTKSNGSKWFNSILVYKHDSTQEQKLVINVDTPRARPLARHKDSLEKKCGPKSMEWNWLSFITKTSDYKIAKNQQCHYEYFKEASDKEAWELFQAVLGGTDSILGYLQTNVKR
ncbi:polysaccharide lyase [Oceanospirillaceae bacterium]|nr:polysaccharide lyase [Oceanospirillaceae bacterium]